MKSNNIIVAFCIHTIMHAGFSENTTVKIIPKYLKKFDMYKNEIRRSSTLLDLYTRQNILTNNENLSIQTWPLSVHDCGGLHAYIQYSNKAIKIIKENVKNAIGINLSKKKQTHALDFDIICGEDQLFSVICGEDQPLSTFPFEINFGHTKARNLSKGDNIVCMQKSCMTLKEIHEIIDIYNSEHELFKLICQEKCMVLISRHGAMALPEIVVEN